MTKEAQIQYFIDALEAKDLYTQGHSHHVSAVVNAIIGCLPASYQMQLDQERLLTAAFLHDIGKIMTPSQVLNKEGALNDEEWHIMRQHPLQGKEMVQQTEFADLGDWILYHHERMDGRGYYGLNGQDIPLEARIIAIADVFSALRTYRIYRPAKSITETIQIMRDCEGTQLDAQILNYFLAMDVDTLEILECNCEICRQRRKALETIA